MKPNFNEDFFDTYLGGDENPQKTTETKHFPPILFEEPNPADYPIMEPGKNGGTKFNPNGVLSFLSDCKVVFDGQIPRRFDGRVYSELPRSQLDDLIYRSTYAHGYIPSTFDVSRVVKAATSLLKAESIAFPDPEMAFPYDGARLLAFENGVLNLDTMQLHPFSPFLFLTGYLRADYDPNVRDAPARAVLQGIIPQAETLDFLFEMLGYIILNPDLNPPAIFNLYGPGNTGKSAIAHMIRTLMGDCVSEIGLTQLTARFTVAELEGKVLNICGETGDTSSKLTHFDGELMKRLSDGAQVMVERKGQNPYYIRNTAKFLFVTNTIPDFGDNSSGLYRRLYVIPCRVKQDPSAQIYDLLTDPASRSWLINRAMAAFDTFKDTHRFSVSPQMEEELTQYQTQDSVMDFLVHVFGATNVPVVAHRITEDDVLCYTVELYQAYLGFCRESLSQPLSRKKFLAKIRNEYSLKQRTVSYTEGGRVTTRNRFYMM